MVEPLTLFISHDDLPDHTFTNALSLMRERLGDRAIAEWLHAGVPEISVDAFLNSYEGGLHDWWGLGSVFLWELSLVPTFKVDTKGVTITIE